MRKTRVLSALLVLVLLFSLCASAFAADTKSDEGSKRVLSGIDNPRVQSLQELYKSQYKPGDQVRAIVLTKSQPTAENRGLIQRVINTDGKLMREHSAVKTKMEAQQIGYKVNFEYTALLNGMSVTMDFADLDKVAALPGVEKIIIAREYRLPETQPSAVSASDMIGASALSQYLGADGSGKVIAVLDTGITADHEAFAVYDGMLQTPALEKVDTLKQIVDIGHGTYLSAKIPFAYDYADSDNDASDDHSGHGSHVAGIAAGYAVTDEGEVTFHGSAPDAQILAMKVFPSDADTTSSDIYIAALEDAFKLGADVINMSLGSPNGFVENDESALNDQIYHRLENAGVICCMSAGNESSMAEYAQNWTGGGYVKADYTDYGVLGAPASYNGNVAVAAVENAQYPAYMITVGEESFPYLDSNGTAFLDAFAGQDLEYVMVPGLGAADDYADIDVKGKIAVISRGDITFAEKVATAAAAGAIGVVIYNNQAGSLVSMAIDDHVIPSVFTPQEAGAALAAAETKTFHVDSEKSIMENPDAWSVSTFSSWGPTNDLQIKPTIAGVGGNVNSVSAGTENGYEVMSGTSMSSPNAAGGYAALLEALCADDPDLSKAEAAAIARSRAVSHAYVLPADVIRDEEGYPAQDENGDYTFIPYSPRQQGAGLMDVAAAYTSVLDIADPLAELGDDPAKSGVYTITADLENTSDAERTYAVMADVLADNVTGGNFGTDEEPDIHIYNAMSSALLEEGVDYTIDAPETVTLAAGEKKTVTVTITLTDDMKEGYLDAYFENGAFIDGYVYFMNLEDEELAHVTFLGFYGDWSAAPILETHDWRDLMNVEVDPEYSEDPMDYVDWEIDTVPTMAYLIDGEYNPQLYAGDAPFGYPEDGAYSDARIAVSNNTDSAYFTNMLVVPTIIRNARHIVMIARNAETGEIYFVDDTPYCEKTIYDPEQGAFTNYAWFLFDGMDSYNSEEPVPVADDTAVVLEFYANLPYGEDALGSMTPEEIVSDGAQYLAYTVPCVVDGAAPMIEDVKYDPETGDVTATITDNQYLAAIYAVDEAGNDLCEPLLFADDAAGESHTVTLNVGEQETFYLSALDYATNEAAVLVAGPHDHDWSEWETVSEPTCDEDGEQARTCAICGETETEAIPALGHALKEVAEVPATCKEDGVKAYYKCETCGKLFADAEGKTEIEEPEAIPAGHSLKAVAEVPATCEDAGVKAYYKCEACGKLFSDAEAKYEIAKPEAIAKLGHTVEAVAAVSATCETDGVKAYYKCETCGKLFKDAAARHEIEEPETIAALGHDLKAVAEVPATCEKTGVKAHYKCDVCGKLFSDAAGKHEITEAEAIAKLSHSMQAIAEVPATCTKAGVKAYYKCDVCGKLFSDAAGTNKIAKPEAIAALGHSLTEVAEVPATCEATGVKAYFKCETCGKLFSDAAGKYEIAAPEVTAKLSHSLAAVAEVPATCESAGVKAHYKCESCGKLFSDAAGKHEISKPEAIAKLAHSLTAVAEVPATCEADGVKAYYKCDVCGKLFSDATGKTAIAKPEAIAKLGHAWDDGVVTKEPTLAAEGEKLFTCQNDPSHTRTEVIEKLYDCDGGKTCPTKDYTDVNHKPDSWSHEPIDWAVLSGITVGTSKTTFSPAKVCTRAEGVTFLWRAAGCPEPESLDNPFKDVTLDTWYAKAVLWATEQGIVKGTSETTFSPDMTCSRAHIVTFLWRMENQPKAKTASSFDDVSAKAYYAKAIDWAVEQSITKGMDPTHFAPNGDCTRAHIVTFLFRQFGK